MAAPPIDPIRLTRELMDIDSTTGREGEAGEYLLHTLAALGYQAKPIPVPGQPARFNVYAHSAGQTPDIVLSTHMDTVPPYITGSEDDDYLYGRGSCDAKGIIAAQVAAAQQLRTGGAKVGLLYTVGEERDSIGARTANAFAPGCRILINGEPTDNRMALASKGTLHLTLRASGKMAHSAYPELGDSAIHKLIHVLEDVLRVPLPSLEDIGPCTLNVGLIEGGHAPNVISDTACAKLLVRLVGPSGPIIEAVRAAIAGRAEMEIEKETPFIRLATLPGMPTMVASFGTDIPSLPDWGTPALFGPGSIHVAHTPHERLSKKEQSESIGHYVRIAERLLAQAQ